jgi:peptidoglycan hydrolase-like protein with peptidoglycan-binding domain
MSKIIISFKKSRSIAGAGLIAAALVAMSIPAISRADTLNRELQVGSTGSDVSSLQSFLAQDRTLYPQGLVTGYFGFLTKAAVSNFQSRNGIAPVGRVGPITLPVLNLQMSAGMSSLNAPKITAVNVGVNNNSATVNWNTDEASKGVVYYSTVPLSLNERTNSVDISGNGVMTDANFRTTQNIQLLGLAANTTYYYSVYSTNQQGNASLSWPATFRTSN